MQLFSTDSKRLSRPLVWIWSENMVLGSDQLNVAGTGGTATATAAAATADASNATVGTDRPLVIWTPWI